MLALLSSTSLLSMEIASGSAEDQKKDNRSFSEEKWRKNSLSISDFEISVFVSSNSLASSFGESSDIGLSMERKLFPLKLSVSLSKIFESFMELFVRMLLVIFERIDSIDNGDLQQLSDMNEKAYGAYNIWSERALDGEIGG